jgi:hypothetical protein
LNPRQCHSPMNEGMTRSAAQDPTMADTVRLLGDPLVPPLTWACGVVKFTIAHQVPFDLAAASIRAR